MRTVAIINQKGGCGKTTTAINLSGLFARRGARTLLVDMDPQSHCAAGLAIPENRIDLDIGDAMLLDQSQPLEPARLLWRISRNLDLAPSRMKLAGLEAKRGGLVDKPECERRLHGALERIAPDYDACVIDCSPSIGLLTYNAMIAAETILIPVETSFFSLQGASKQIASIETLNKRLGTSLPHWLLPTIHDPSSPLARDLLEELRRRFAHRVAPTAIRQDPAVREAASFGLPVVEYAPDAPGTSDHAALAAWLGERLGIPLPEPFDAATEPRGQPGGGGSDPQTGPGPLGDQAPAHGRPARHDRERDVRVRTTAETERGLARRVARADGPEEAGRPDQSAPGPGQPGESTPADAPARSEPGATPQPGAAPPPSAEQHASGSVDEPLMSRAEDLLRRACALQRRREGIGTALEPAREPASSEADSPPTPEPRPSVRRLLGARVTTSGALFIQPLPVGEHVAIAGSFNDWSATAHPMRRNPDLGVFELCIQLPPGRHAYRLVIDGRWTSDPYNEHCESNPFGQTNSVIVVPRQPRSVPVPALPSTAPQRSSHE